MKDAGVLLASDNTGSPVSKDYSQEENRVWFTHRQIYVNLLFFSITLFEIPLYKYINADIRHITEKVNVAIKTHL